MLGLRPLRRSALALALAAAWATAGPAARAAEFVDPEGRYAFSLPAGARAEKPDGPIDVAVRSAKGYVVNVQSGRSAEARTPADMLRVLESRYYGPDRPWSAKRDQRELTVGGFPAAAALYAGNDMLTRAVVVRAVGTDLVLTLIAGERQFAAAEGEFSAMLASLRAPAAGTVAPGPPAQGLLPGQTAAAQETQTPLPKRFEDAGLGFRIDLPEAWAASRPGPHSVVFADPREGLGSITVQNVQPRGAGGPAAALQAVIDQLAAEYARLAGAEELGQGPAHYVNEGLRLDGRQFLIRYPTPAGPFVQWTVVVPRSQGTVVHVWSYAAPAAAFEVGRETAAAILTSWTLARG